MNPKGGKNSFKQIFSIKTNSLRLIALPFSSLEKILTYLIPIKFYKNNMMVIKISGSLARVGLRACDPSTQEVKRKEDPYKSKASSYYIARPVSKK